MDETATKADVERLRQDLQTDLRDLHKDLRATETRLETKIGEVDQRLGAKIDDVDQRLGAKIGDVDQRLDAKMDSGFALVARHLAETEDRLKRHTDMRFEQVREGIQKVADGVLAINERLDQHIQQNDAEHARLDRTILAGDAALDKRVTALELPRPN